MTLALAASVLLTAAVQGTYAQTAAGVVSHVKVVSDKVEDVSSLEAWKNSFIKPGMTEQQKAIAIWTTVCKFRHQTAPPDEFLQPDGNVHDPIKVFNVYGYGMCCCASGNIESLARYAGMEAKGWGINAHSVPEIKVDGHWGLFDASLMNYFMLPDKKTVAGVLEINASIVEWIEKNPDFKSKDKQGRYALMKNGAWKTNGPEVLKGSATFDNGGWQPAKTHAWGDTIMEYGGAAVAGGRKPFEYDYAAAIGYEVNIQLRPGEKITRGWTNEGHHVNEIDGGKDITKDSSLGYAAKWGDLNTTARIGNGTITYDLPLANGKFKTGMLTVDNLVSKAEAAGPAVHVKDSAKPSTLIFRMPSSYVYLGGMLNLNAAIPSGGSIDVSLSENNGLDWKSLGSLAAGEQAIDLKPHIYRRYDYRLKFEFKGAGTGLESVKVVNNIQNSTRALPALDTGENKIAFTSAAQEGTITVYGNMKGTTKNLSFDQFHPDRQGKTITVPITTPGDITRIRIGAAYRCYNANDAFLAQASFDEGKTWIDFGKLDGVGRGMSKTLVLEGAGAGAAGKAASAGAKIPAKATSVQVRTNKQGGPDLADLRIDVDYKEPNGGFLPIKITYDWEGGSDTHIAKTPTDNYVIKCANKPQLKSITMEVAP